MVTPAAVAEEDEAWASGLEAWRQQARRITGNRIEIIEVSQRKIARLLKGREPLWSDVARDGLVIFGRPLSELTVERRA